MNLIFDNQLKTINLCRDYLRYSEKKKISIDTSPVCFFTIWAETIGKIKLLQLLKSLALKNIFTIFKNFIFIGKNHDLTLITNGNQNFNEKFNVIVSYSQKENFDLNGNFYDSYFNISSKNLKNTYWFLISLDNKIPKKVKKNILIFKKKQNKSYSLLFFFKIILKIFIRYRFSLKKFFHYCWVDYNLAEIISEKFTNFFKNKKINNVLLNYEGIPFQNYLLKSIKKINPKIQTLGYLHCAPWPVQTDLFYKKQKLDKFIVSGNDQKKILTQFFDWNNKKIFVVPSLRFRKTKEKQFSGNIFVPYDLTKGNNYIQRFDTFLKNSAKKSLNFFKVRIHPLKKNSNVHKQLAEELKKIIKLRKNKFSSKRKNQSIFLGSATGVCIQALEEGNEIIHFPENHYLDTFSDKIWTNINVSKVDKYIYKYNLIKNGQVFITNNRKDNFKKFIEPHFN